MEGLASELRTLSADIEEKKLRLDKVKKDIKEANFEERLNERASKARVMDDKRDSLNAELRGLSLQADARARLDVKRSEVKSRTLEIQNTCGDFPAGFEIGMLMMNSLVGLRRVIPSSGNSSTRMHARRTWSARPSAFRGLLATYFV
jgi:hypothetical protein